MKKTYKIEVDCANCANKMEEAAKNTAGVKNANVNFMTLKMSVEFEEGQDPKAVMQDVLKNCKKVEDDCKIFCLGACEINPNVHPRLLAVRIIMHRFARQNDKAFARLYAVFFTR